MALIFVKFKAMLQKKHMFRLKTLQITGRQKNPKRGWVAHKSGQTGPRDFFWTTKKNKNLL